MFRGVRPDTHDSANTTPPPYMREYYCTISPYREKQAMCDVGYMTRWRDRQCERQRERRRRDGKRVLYIPKRTKRWRYAKKKEGECERDRKKKYIAINFGERREEEEKKTV